MDSLLDFQRKGKNIVTTHKVNVTGQILCVFF